jgi:nitroreductase
MSMLECIDTDLEILRELADRQSPRCFSEEPVATEQLLKLLEAARWAPSCFNEQPWRFVLAFKKQGLLYQNIIETLVPDNARWAASAQLLIVACVVRIRERNNQPNPTAEYDLGLAVSQLTIQATSMGLGVHQIAGFNPIRLARSVPLPSGVEPLVWRARRRLRRPRALKPSPLRCPRNRPLKT